MIPCNVVEFKTPKGFNLIGLWYGPRRAKRVVIFIHGLTGSVFSTLQRELGPLLANSSTAVLSFNNRGHDIVSKVYKDAPRSKKGSVRVVAGSAHEKFADCADDIQGAINFVRRAGVKNIFLAGHSTGCQKSVYWAYKKKTRGVKGIILLAPVSDYAVARERGNLKTMVRYGRALLKRGESHRLLKGETYDAQRFLSLYTSDSPEEIFTYVQPKKRPRMLRSVEVPILVLWAGRDEFNDRPVADITKWFKDSLKNIDRVRVIPNVLHSFRGAERKVANEIRKFISG